MSNITPNGRQAVYRMKHLPARVGLSIPMIYREIREGNFPPGRKVADNVRVWTEEEMEVEVQRRFAKFNNPGA